MIFLELWFVIVIMEECDLVGMVDMYDEFD